MGKVEDVIANATPEPEVKEIEDTKTEDKVEDSELKGKEEKKEDDGPGVVAKIMKGLGIGKTDDGLGKSDKDDEDIEGEDIPDEFTEAALKNGWAESDVEEFASNHSNDELIEMIPYLAAEDKSESGEVSRHGSLEEKTQGTVFNKKQEPEKKSEIKDDDETKDESEAIKEMRKEIADLKESRKKDDDVQKAKAHEALMESVDKAFDEADEKFGIFGKSEELPRFPVGPRKGQLIPTSPAFKARSEVWDVAAPLIEVGTSAKKAMNIALTWYKGEHLDKEVERKYIKKLKDGEKKLSAKRQGKETQKTYENEEERGADVVRDLARKAGVKGELDE